jgi:transposase InsO family protein
VGGSYDNALAETINGLYKTEVIYRLGPWRNLQAVEMATLEWVGWFNHRRLLESRSAIFHRQRLKLLIINNSLSPSW